MAVRLPRYHVSRPRLTDALDTNPLAVVIAGGGYGKSLLAAEMCDRRGVPAITAVLEPDGGSADALLLRIRDSARGQGLSDVAAAMDLATGDDRVDALLRTLGEQSAVIVIDELQHLKPDGAALLTRLTATLTAGQRLLLVGRHEPAEILRLRTSRESTLLGTAELALTVDEVAQLCRAFALELDDVEVAAVHATTDGWVAAVVLLASRARVAGGATIDPSMQGGPAMLTGLVDEILRAMPRREQDALIDLAHLPLLDDALAEHAAGIEGVLTTARRAGLPLIAGGGGWVQLIGPVRDELNSRGPARPAVVRRAADAYALRGMHAVAAELLLAVGEASAAAGLLAGLSQPQLETLELPTLSALIDALPERVVSRFPRVLLQLARACEPAAATRRRAATLERAMALATAAADGPLVRELQAEAARDIARDNGNVEAEKLARAALAETGATEELTRARLLDVLGQVAAWQRDDVHLDEAYNRMSTAAQIYRAHEQRSWLAQVMMPLAVWVHAPRGEFVDAVRCLDEALALAPEPRLRRGVILTFRAEIMQDIGRFDEASANVVEALAIADTLGDVRLRAYAHWDVARSASQTGDAAATRLAVHAVEANLGEWFDQSGCLFLADAANFLDRVELADEAQEYLLRAKAHPEPDPPGLVRAEAALLARNGDPDAAERCIEAMLAASWFEPRDRWHATLLRARAAMRRGDPAAADLTVEALEQAARLGYPNLPLIRERTVTEHLLGLAAGSARLAALDYDATSLPVVVSLLGGFEVSRGGRSLDLPVGQGRQLVKVVACAGGRISADAVVELLWPETDPDVSANRLRTVLNRLRESVGDVIVREDRLLRLAPHVETDAQRFEAQAHRALALASSDPATAVSLARGALASYRGELLPGDPYGAWTIGPRERIKRRAVALFDLCATRAAAAHDLDDAVRCLERAIELVPDEEERYLAAARHLLAQGRRGAARAQVARARSVLDELGLLPPPAMRQLEEQVRRV